MSSKSRTEREAPPILQLWMTKNEVAGALQLTELEIQPRVFVDPPDEPPKEVVHWIAALHSTHGMELGFNDEKRLVLIVRREHVSDETTLFQKHFNEIAIRSKIQFGMPSREVASLVGRGEKDIHGYAKELDTPTEQQLQFEPIYYLDVYPQNGQRLGLDFNRLKKLVGINQYITPEK